MEKIYKTKRPIDGKKPIWVIVDEDGKVINKNPSKDQLKNLEKELRYPQDTRKGKVRLYTDKELLDYLIQFYEKYGRIPGAKDFDNNPEFPSRGIYHLRFGSWKNALKLVGLDLDTRVIQGYLDTNVEKGRFGEILIRDHFENNPVDLAGENKKSHCDGICPNGKTYDVKSSKLHIKGDYMWWDYNTSNKYKEEIEIYYFLAFNEDWTKLLYVWRIPGEIIGSEWFQVRDSSNAKFNIESMGKYDVTEKLREVLTKYGYFEKIKNYRKAKDKGLAIYEYDKQLYDGCLVIE